MIPLKVPKAYAYDYLSIFDVKLTKGVVSEYDFKECSVDIATKIGIQQHFDILASQYYKELYRLNLATWDAVDLAKIDAVKASYVHNLNTERWKAKKTLQEYFFPRNEFKEKKN